MGNWEGSFAWLGPQAAVPVVESVKPVALWEYKYWKLLPNRLPILNQRFIVKAPDRP